MAHIIQCIQYSLVQLTHEAFVFLHMDNQQVIFSSFFFTWTSFILVGRFAKVIRKRRNQRCEKFPTDCMFPESVSVNFETTKLCWKQNNVSKLKNVFPYENCDLKPN